MNLSLITTPFFFKVQMPSSKNPSHKKVYKFMKANLDRLNELFNFVPWTCAFLTDDVQEKWLKFKDLFFTSVDACLPTKLPRKMKNTPRLTLDVLKLIRQKIILYKRAKVLNCDNLWVRNRNLNYRTKKACNHGNTLNN